MATGATSRNRIDRARDVVEFAHDQGEIGGRERVKVQGIRDTGLKHTTRLRSLRTRRSSKHIRFAKQGGRRAETTVRSDRTSCIAKSTSQQSSTATASHRIGERDPYVRVAQRSRGQPPL